MQDSLHSGTMPHTMTGMIVVDNLEAVADSCFIDRSWPTEHYNETGRRIIARNLADSLRLIYPNFYLDSK